MLSREAFNSFEVCFRSSMDRALASEAGNLGSTPNESSTYKPLAKSLDFFKQSQLKSHSQPSGGASLQAR